MDLRPPLQLQSMIKSMGDVVLPAIDPNNKMAQEQAQLILGMMHLLALRLPLQFHYDIDELQRYAELARELLDETQGGTETNAAMAQLARAAASSSAMLERAQTAPEELEAAVLELRNQIAALVDAVWRDGDADCRQRSSKAVLAASKAQILRERAWFAPQGWDADMSAYPTIESLINDSGSDREHNDLGAST